VFLAYLLVNEVVDAVTDLLLVLRVHLLDGRHDSGGVSKESLLFLLVCHLFRSHLNLRHRLLLDLTHRLRHHGLRLWHHLLLSGSGHILREVLLLLLHHVVTVVHALLMRILLTTTTLEALVATLMSAHVLSRQKLEHVLEK